MSLLQGYDEHVNIFSISEIFHDIVYLLQDIKVLALSNLRIVVYTFNKLFKYPK